MRPAASTGRLCARAAVLGGAGGLLESAAAIDWMKELGCPLHTPLEVVQGPVVGLGWRFHGVWLWAWPTVPAFTGRVLTGHPSVEIQSHDLGLRA